MPFKYPELQIVGSNDLLSHVYNYLTGTLAYQFSLAASS